MLHCASARPPKGSGFAFTRAYQYHAAARGANREGIVALSRSMSPGLVLQAYRKGIFPWPIAQGLVPWASPDPRAVFPLWPHKPWPRHVRRALRQDFTVTYDQGFEDVLRACGDE